MREVDPSWVGSRWALDAGWSGSPGGRPFRVAAEGSLLHRDFRTGDSLDLGHHDRLDVGGHGRVGVALGLPTERLLPSVGTALALSYRLDWNHTNLAPGVKPDDASDYADHRVVLALRARSLWAGKER